MKKLFKIFIVFFYLQSTAQPITTPFEVSLGQSTPNYFNIINWWQQLSKKSTSIHLMEVGPTDAGYPLHVVLISTEPNLTLANVHKKNKRIIFINNGIHPGEPDGIDACMLLARNIVTKQFQLPENIILAIIPIYNIGGCLNRSSFLRVDQNGPDAFGTRGNSQNLDLNRDFIKCDSKEAVSFSKLFHNLDPDIFIDNHVSDGADYQHVITLISTQHNKLGGNMGNFLNEKFTPALVDNMQKKGYDLIPYVNDFDETPENGWNEFWDSPRYSSGYASLWNCFAFIPETHMLKPYPIRVKATLALMESFINFTSLKSEVIKQLRQNANQNTIQQSAFTLNWGLDKTKFTNINFKGYAGLHKLSDVSGLPRLYYDHSKPFEKNVPFYNEYIAKLNIIKPKAYLIPKGWWRVITLLQNNQVKMYTLKQDTSIEVEAYHITSFKSSQRPYEMHHTNSEIKTTTTIQKMFFMKGDYVIPMNQKANRFIVETLEPEAEDAYFVWNFFDAILGQKEGFSSYSFEDTASNYLKKHLQLKQILEEKKQADTLFSKSAYEQLNFVFKNSPYFEPAFMLYPVYRIMK